MFISNKIKLTSLLLSATVLITPQVQASEGYFQFAWGARHSGLAGAGIADITDSTGQIINPAGIVGLEDSQLNLGVTLFSPIRKYTGSGDPSFTQNGEVKSGKNMFFIPTITYSAQIDETSAWGLAMYGNGGMNTSYPGDARPLPDCPPVGGAGIFCGGPSGVDLMQGFVAGTYAKSFGKVSVGISPLFAFQLFEAKGLGAFGGFSSDPTSLTDNGHDTSTGFGVKVSVQADMSDTIRVAASYQPKINMSEFGDYAGLFADGGDFDIPENYVIGAAVDVTDNITVMADYKHISYTGVGAVSNATTVMLPFGADGGPGFGWEDVDAFKVGVEVRYSEKLDLRFGVSTNNNPVGPEDVTLNILAPGVVKTRFTAGFAYKTSQSSAFEFAAAYVPNVKVTGAEQFNPNHTVDIEMHQTVFTFSWSKSF